MANFKVDRADDCIWLNDNRTKTADDAVLTIHLVPSQAKRIGETLIEAAVAGKEYHKDVE